MTEVLLESKIRVQLESGARELGLDLAPQTLDSLLRFQQLLEKWTRTYNLTAIRDAERIVSHHLLDSLAVARYLSDGRVLDVGSGGGFPGVPLALARPDLSITLLDSNQKKTAFLRQAATDLQLRNVEVVCARVEDWKAALPYDWILSRAFAELSDFVQGAAHLLAPRGFFAAMKGVEPREEIARLPQGFKLRELVRLEVPGVDQQRHLVIVERA
jgi:16S rRNA (guanine527-N7)-methyltransferase